MKHFKTVLKLEEVRCQPMCLCSNGFRKGSYIICHHHTITYTSHTSNKAVESRGYKQES